MDFQSGAYKQGCCGYFCTHFCMRNIFLLNLSKSLTMKSLDHVRVGLIVRSCQTVFQGVALLCIPNTLNCQSFNFTLWVAMECYLIRVLVWIFWWFEFLVESDVKYFFICFLAFTFFLLWIVFWDLLSIFSVGLINFWLFSFMQSLVSGSQFVPGTYFENIYLHSKDCLTVFPKRLCFIVFNDGFQKQKINFGKVLFNVLITLCAFLGPI